MIISEMKLTFKDVNDIVDFVNRVEKFPYNMDMQQGQLVVDAKSLLGIMNLGLNQAVNLTVYSEECKDLEWEIKNYIT